MEVRRFLRRCLRLLWVINLAACWIALRESPKRAALYLHRIWTIYLHRSTLLSAPSCPLTLTRRSIEEVFPGIDLRRVELLYPLPHPGSVTFEELVFLACLIRHLRPKRIVEIGTAQGRTTLNLALHAPEEAEVITLDLPAEQTGGDALRSGPDWTQMKLSRPGALFAHHPDIASKIRLVLADSTAFDWAPYEQSVDFVFIDGAHDYESVRKDTENALRILREGGVIVWHDYGNWEGVSRWLNELGARLPIVWLERTSLACLRGGVPVHRRRGGESDDATQNGGAL